MPFTVIPSGYTGEQRVIRFNHQANSWQRQLAYGWVNIPVAMARFLFDQGFSVWGVK